ncbi:hypothetical protein GGTG_10054 [Gaeumannomyces tritici R3-111a-1]|uniref:Thiamine-binding protein domain-containing protein n=1 Tax=Gaeumannomyces tritici (strain R3-111a-1) TaxID=644352 RepID=J3P969_GAET3|nr:hypothetical protein GGTG_10054 [Gaeumannomyces tritici R3-111a-1]EJT73205.1 hypothetical protein GGTG_10054 [Gaeumannomyces tritici R3-111a-1]
MSSLTYRLFSSPARPRATVTRLLFPPLAGPAPHRAFATRKKKQPSMDTSSIETPAACYADFCLIPVGVGVSVANEVAEVQRLLKASGIKYTMHSAGTTVEGSWDEVMKVIGQAHAVVHRGGCQRVQSSLRVGTRTDKQQTASEKVKRVEDILAGTST